MAINSCISGKLEQGSNQKPVPSHWTTTLVCITGCALLNNEVTVSSITKCLSTSTICREVASCDKKLCVVLSEADIFNKAVQGNIPKPLKNLCIKFDVNTLGHCGEMACVEKHLHTFGNSDTTISNSIISHFERKAKTWTYTCTFVAFHSLIYSWGVAFLNVQFSYITHM